MADTGRPGPMDTGWVTGGILMMLLANLFFAMVDTSTKWLLLAGIPALQAAFFRYAIHFALSLGDAGRQATAHLAEARAHAPLLILRALCLLAATVVNFIALKVLPLSVTAAILFAAPIIVCLLSGPMLGEKVGPWRWAAILFGFLGVLVIIRPFGDAFDWMALMMLIPATGMALYSILTRKLIGQVDASVMQVVVGAVGTVVLLPLVLFLWTPATSPLGWVLLPFLGLAAWIGHGVMIRAHRHAPSSVLMPYSYSFLLYLTVSGIVVFGEYPDAPTLIGAGMIVVSGLVIWARERRGG